MKTLKLLVSIGFCAMTALPLLAADSGAGQADQSTGGDGGSADGASVNTGKGKHAHQHKGQGGGGRNHANHPSKKEVMGLSDLSDKQKSQIGGVYDANKAQFADLHKQLRELEAKEWDQIKGFLTPAQMQTLGFGGAAGGGAAAGSSGADDSGSASK